MAKKQGPFGFGIDGTTGAYLPNVENLNELGRFLLGGPRPTILHRAESTAEASLDPIDDADLMRLACCGWGVIFGRNVGEEVREALRPLLEHRRAVAGKLVESAYREFWGDDGCAATETAESFLNRHQAPADGPVDPAAMPYYLLLVGGPQEISFAFQYDLDVEFAVGRIAFESPEEYRRYALAVVAAERAALAKPHCTFFSPTHPGDTAGAAALKDLVEPLRKDLAERHPDWTFDAITGAAASKESLARLLLEKPPSLLFAAGHGMAFHNSDPRQRLDQGAMVCSDWPGRQRWKGPPAATHYLGADDLPDSVDLQGSIVFQFACFSAGTPQFDDFRLVDREFLSVGEAFLARLPQRLLAPASGKGALAFIGHIDRVWTHSFRRQHPTLFDRVIYREVLGRLVRGLPVGHAMQLLNRRHAHLAARQAVEHDRLRSAEGIDLAGFAHRWLLLNDARNFFLIGDPATRLSQG